MKKKLYPILLICSFFVIVNTEGQIRFENGYFIDLSGNKTVCLIRNKDWMFNPYSFEYKLDDNSQKLKKGIADVKEFGIGDCIKYLSTSVQMDTSTDKLDDAAMSNTYNPEWKEMHVFLKVLVEGKASLYIYDSIIQGQFSKRMTSPVITMLKMARGISFFQPSFISWS